MRITFSRSYASLLVLAALGACQSNSTSQETTATTETAPADSTSGNNLSQPLVRDI